MRVKILIVLGVLLVALGGAFTMQTNSELARVPKVQGKYLFFCCEPVQDYEVVQGDYPVSVWNIKEPGNFVYPALKKAEQKGWDFDALKIDINGRFELIKFTEQ